MPTVLFLVILWLLYKAARAVQKPRKRKEPQRIETRCQINMAALDALQQQQEQIENTIDYIKESITTAETPEKTIQYMDRLQALYGKLATVENKINRLTR